MNTSEPAPMLTADQLKVPSRGIQAYFHGLGKQISTRASYWKGLFTITVLVAFFYVFMEWLFFVTMPSFMSLLGFVNKLEIFLISGLGFVLLCLVLLAVFIVIDILAITAHASKVTYYWGPALPSIILSALVLLLVDNFTYTVFKFGVATSSGVFRGVYALFFVIMAGYIYYRMLRLFSHGGAQLSRRWFFLAVGLLSVAIPLGVASINYKNIQQANNAALNQAASRLPNILLLGSDGVNAANMSVYGYNRETTPRMEVLAQNSLVAENAFTNAANTAGSVISIMTSKLPTQTRVLYPPDILTGINSFQHLPGILNNLGYRTIEYGVPYYIDASNYNMQDGFDVVNNRANPTSKLAGLSRKFGFESEAYFLSRIIGRIVDRILHIFFIREMPNPYAIVTRPAANIDDQTKINQALAQFKQSQQPIFIHIHLLGTHGGYYSPTTRLFSASERQTDPWMTDFYDDTLFGFDALVGKVIDQLKANGQYDNTILIIYTDHNKEFRADGRIPLIIHFPQGEYAGEITRNVQNMDIAPTILDYLGLAKPAWMDGESLLKEGAEDRRLIFSTGTTKIKPNKQEISFLDPNLNKPPFYQFSYINVVDCQRVYSFDLTTYQWSSKDVVGYVDPCKEQDLLSRDQIKQAVYQRLAEDGFDVSSLSK